MSKKNAAKQEIQVLRPLHKWLIQIAILIVLLIAGYFVALYLYHAAKLWRARSMAREVMAQLDTHQPAEGEGDKLIAAYQLAGWDPEVLRACARYSQSQGSPEALTFYQQLLSEPNPTKEDQRAALRSCLLFGNLQIAGSLVQMLTENNPETDDWVCKAQFLWQVHQVGEAISLMREQAAAAPENRSYQFLLAQMEASTNDDANQEAAMASFQKLAQGKDEPSLLALIAISHATGLDKPSLQAALKKLNEHPLRDDTSRFAAWELDASLGDRPPKVVMQEVVNYYQSSDLPHKSRAARWLDGHNQPELALQLATQTDAIESKELFMVRLDALAHLGDWNAVVKEMNDTHVPISPTLVFLYRARAAHELSDPDGSKTNWDRARTAATGEPGMLAYLGDYALRTGAYEEAQKTFEVMAQSPTDAEAGYTALVKLTAQHGTALDLLEMLRRMTTALPEKPEAKNDWAYLSLLLNKDVEKAAKAAHELVAAHPEMLAYRSTLAMAYFRQNDFSGAVKLYEGQQIDWEASPASWKMVYAVVLAASGNLPDAQSFARTINRSQLRPEERDLLNTWLPAS